MQRREFIKTAAMAMGAPTLLSTLSHAADRRKPNVIVIFIDDLAYGELGAFGCTDIPTPHMDSLAENGVKCTNTYVTNPPCSPSRCAMMTGMYAQRFGKFGMARGLPIPNDHPTMAEFMQSAGYTTGMIGKWDLGSEQQGPLDRGFDYMMRKPEMKEGKRYIFEKEDGTDGFLTDLDGEYLVDFVTNHKENPFFLYYAPYAIHSPNSESPEHYRARSTATGRRRALAGNLIALDDAIGRLLIALDENKLREDTLILFTSDNGGSVRDDCRSTPYRGGKGSGTQQEGWVRAATIASWPGVLPQGEQYNGLSCTLDFYATIAAAIGKPLPERCEGQNLMPYLKGDEKGDSHDALYWCNKDPKDAPRRHLKAMRWKQWRLYLDKEEGWKLFDLVKDPEERKDLADAHPEVFKEMMSRYEAWENTLPPIISIADDEKRPGGLVPTGFGWATDVKEVWG